MTPDDSETDDGADEKEKEEEEEEKKKKKKKSSDANDDAWNEKDDDDDEEEEDFKEQREKTKSKRIAVYLRLKPASDALSSWKRVRMEENDGNGSTEKKKKKMVSFECDDEREKDHRGDDEKTTIKKYAKRSQMFAFDEILDENASQEETFDTCARNVVLNCLDGVNATIFAYAQTGSGKTHTFTGGNDGAFENRGIIPRSLETLFREMEKRKSEEEEKSGSANKVITFDATCEYVEVYNEQAYDLLGRDDLNRSMFSQKGALSVGEYDDDDDDDGNEGDNDYNEKTSSLKEKFEVSRVINDHIDLEPSSSSSSSINYQQNQLHLPRVYLQEDEKKTFHLKGISSHRIRSEEEAMDLLFAGDANRAVAETPLNLASSRSHCVFTITIEKRISGDDTLQRAKLNIVDLAGSERVSKTKIDGSVLTEAKYINLSLHFLERVIVALQEQQQLRRRKNDANATYHVPYRNSIVTSMLRDSLGGNCNTVMIATCSHDETQLTESVATCRFAQRVSCVTNEYHVNQEIVPELVIKRLRAENSRLIEELKALKEAYTILERKFSGARDYGDDDYDDGKCVGLSLKPSPVAALSIEQKKEENEIEEDREEKGEEEEDKEGEEEDEGEEQEETRDDVDINEICEQHQAENPNPVNPRTDDSDASSDTADDANFDLDYNRSLLLDKKLAFAAFLSSSSPHILALSQSITTNEQKKTSTLAVAALVRERVLQLKLDFANLRQCIESTRIQKEASRLNPSSDFSFSERAIHERKLLEQIKSKKIEHSNAVRELRELKGVVAVVSKLIEKSRVRLREEFETWYRDLEERCKRIAKRRAEEILRKDEV